MLWHCWLGSRKGIRPVTKWGDGGGGHWLVRMEWRPARWLVSASVNLPLHHKVQKFSSGTGSPWWSRKKGHKMVVVVVVEVLRRRAIYKSTFYLLTRAEPACQISRLSVILFQSYHPVRQTDTHNWLIALPQSHSGLLLLLQVIC